MSDHLRSFVTAAVLCIVCSLLLTAAATGLRPLQLRNMQIDRQKNLLRAVNLIDDDASYRPEQIEAIYRDNIQSLRADEEGYLVSADSPDAVGLPLYVYLREGEIDAYIIPIEARGLWGKIHGYLALDNDGSTVTGFTVYKHSETPGLGGEIEQRWFQQNFVGKQIVDRDGHFVSVGIARGAVADRIPADQQMNYVDGISGATLTGKYLSDSMRDVLKLYETVSVRFRQDGGMGL